MCHPVKASSRNELFKLTPSTAAEAIIATMTDALLLVNTNGTIVTVNQGALTLLGYEEKELIGESMDVIITGDKFTKLNEKEMVKYAEVFSKNGNKIPVSLATSFMYDNARNLQQIIFILRDITERKHKEEELKRAYEGLEDFCSIVTHDLKAPLRGITTLSKVLMRDYKEKIDPKGQELFRLLENRVKQMHKLIEDIYEYSKSSGNIGSLDEVNLTEVVLNVIDLLAPPDDIDIEIKKNLPILLGKTIHFFQIFQNLISNAIKFMDKEQGLIVIDFEDKESIWEFSVIDNGPGIPEHHYMKIFQIFQTLNPKKHSKNPGIGLTIVRKLVQRYSGEVWVESKLGKGSTFKFSIPKSRAA